MKTQRFNIFNQIHKALRALMFDTALIIQQTDFSRPEEAEAILQQTDMLLDFMDTHAEHENDFILKAAEKHAPEVIAELEKEHVTDIALASALREKLAIYRAAVSPEECFELGIDILYALNDFIAFNLTHIHKEETVLNGVLWANYSDHEIREIEARIQEVVEPETIFIYFKWMVKGINNAELIGWLTAVRDNAPEFIQSGLLKVCQENLEASRWNAIQLQLTEGELV